MESFEERLERLETISKEIRTPGMSLHDSIALFEEGMNLSKELDTELQAIEQKVQILVSSEHQDDLVFTSYPEEGHKTHE